MEQKVADYLQVDEDSGMMYKLRWLGVFSDEVIGLENATPAEILQHLLENKLSLDSGDIDMIVMQHQFVYELNDEIKKELLYLKILLFQTICKELTIVKNFNLSEKVSILWRRLYRIVYPAGADDTIFIKDSNLIQPNH